MESSSRFISGAALGFVFGLVVAYYIPTSNPWIVGLAIVGATVVFGVLALYFGEDFWDLLSAAMRAVPWL